MKYSISALQELTKIHSVSGDTLRIIQYLQERLKKSRIETKITDFGVLVCGNLKNPKVMISAHVDDVGFQIVNQNIDGTFQVMKSGHVDAAMLNNTTVYVETKKGSIPGVILPKKELGNNNVQNFTDILLDTLNNKSVSIGDFGSYTHFFSQSEDKIIASGLDNRACIEILLEIIIENPQMLKNTLFAFVTEEENTYDCITGISNLYKPQYALVVDMLPVNQIDPTKVERIPSVGNGPAVLYSMHSYKLHPYIRESLKNIKMPYQMAFMDINFPPEPQMVQKNGITKGINIFLPMLGWHNAAYSMQITDAEKTKKFVTKLHSLLLNS